MQWGPARAFGAAGTAESAVEPVAFVACVMSLFFMTATAEQSAAQREATKETAGKAPQSLLARLAWPTLGLVLPVTLAAGWEIAVGMGLSSGRLLPPPSVIFDTFLDLASTGELQAHTLATVLRVAAGFFFGVVAGTIAGAIAGYSTLTHRLIDPTLQGLRAVPSIAWVPLFILWFGIFEASKIILIAVGVFFPVYLGVMGAVISVDRKIVEVGRVFR